MAAGAGKAARGRYPVAEGDRLIRVGLRLLAGSRASGANESAEWLAPLRPVGDDNWAAGVEPASDGNGIPLMNKTGSHACTVRTSDTNNEVRSADKQEY